MGRVGVPDRCILLGWQVDEDGAVYAGFGTGIGKRRLAHGMDGIGVSHQNERGLRVLQAKACGEG